MSTDRQAQARAEAERRYPVYPEFDQDDRDHTNAMRYIFLGGAEWADANPPPHTITRAKAVADSHPDPRCDRYGADDAVTCGWKGAYTDMLDALGIEVEDR